MNRSISKVISAGLSLLLACVSLGFTAPSQAQAAPLAPVTSSYSVTFTATNQNLWGPGQESPNGHQIDLFSETWNEKVTAGNTKKSLGEYGAKVTGRTNGEIGLAARVSGYSNGKVSVNYPVDVTLSWPVANSFKPGETVSIGSSVKVKPNASLTVDAGTGDIDVRGTFDVRAGFDATLCAGKCESESRTPISIHVNDQKIFSLNQLVALCAAGNLEKAAKEGCDTDYFGVSGHVGLPNMKFTSTLENDGKTLKAFAAHANFADVAIDLNGMITTVTRVGLGINLSLLPGLTLEGTALTGLANLRLSQKQEVRFAPVIRGTLALPDTGPEVQYTEKDSTGKVVSSGKGRKLVWDVGNTLEIVIPPNLKAGDVLKATPTFAVKPEANLTNEVTTTIETDLAVQALEANVATPEIPVIGGLDFTLGPLWKKSFARRTEPNTKLFDRNQAPWALGGFAAKVAGVAKEIVLDPDSGPSVLLAPPTPLQGGKRSTTFTVSDAEKNPLTWKMEWGDGKVDTGKANGAGESVKAEHAYAKDGSYVMKLTVDDGDQQTVVVGDAGPEMWAIADGAVSESGVINLTMGFTDPKHAAIKSATINWGDGTKETAGVVSNKPYGPTGSSVGTNGSVSASHTYAESGTYTATATVTDEKGAVTKRPVSVTIGNLPPVVSAEPEQNRLGKVWQCPDCDTDLFSGEKLTLNASFTDPGPADTHKATVDWGDGSPVESVKLFQGKGSSPGTLTASHRFVGKETKKVKICVTDDEGASACDELKVRVWDRHVGMNVMPGSMENKINPNAPVTVAVLTTKVPQYGLVQPFDAAQIKYIHFGANGKWVDASDMKGKAEDALELDEKTRDGDKDMVFQFDPKAIGLNEKSTGVNVQGYTQEGVWFWETIKVNLPAANAGANLPPVVTVAPEINRLGKVGDCPDCAAEVLAGETMTLQGSFTDPNLADTFKAAVDWGDGSPIEAVTLSQEKGKGTVTASHRYVDRSKGSTVTLCVADDKGGVGCKNFKLKVWDRHIGVNVAPGSKDNTISLSAPATVALLTTKAEEYGLSQPFDATRVEYVHFGAAGKWVDSSNKKGEVQDALEPDEKTRDGDEDLVFQFDPKALGLTEKSTEIYVQGYTREGVWFWATVKIRVVK